MKSPKEFVKHLLIGFLMGICDLIPGISGGTIAFITGIYERLITGVKQYSSELFIGIIKYITGKKKAKEIVKKLDLQFFTPLVLGIILAISIGSFFILKLLENYFVITLSFFIGLIAASGFVIFKAIQDHAWQHKSWGLIGFVCGISLLLIAPMESSTNIAYIFFSGFIAITALFLPGISGSFLLLLMGQYEFMLSVLHNIKTHIQEFFSFISGAVLGVVVISRLVTFLLRKWHNQTLYFLLGLVGGSLAVPIKKIFLTEQVWDVSNSVRIVLFLLLGAILVYATHTKIKK